MTPSIHAEPARRTLLPATLTAAAAAALLAGCAGMAAAPSLAPMPAWPPADLKPVAAACTGLVRETVDAAEIGASAGLKSGIARITEATWMPAAPVKVGERGPTPSSLITPATPAYCQVKGAIDPVDPAAPKIHFQINLPERWNGRSLQYGGGGFNGVLISGLALLPAARFDQPAPLAQGYVTYGTDSGHQNQPGQPPQTFALNDEALVNFFHASYKKVRDVAVSVMQRAYGHSPQRLYFVGSSEGGREGVMMAQRYPHDFDGIISRVPVLNWTGLQFAGARNGIATMGDAWIRPAQVTLVHNAVLSACDAADGLADRIVSDPVGCKARFDIRSLQCVAGQTGDSCLSPAQVAAVQTLHSPLKMPYALAHGVTEYPGWGLSGEDTLAYGPTGGWRAWWLGAESPSVPPKPQNSIAWFYGAGALQYFYARDPQADPRTVTFERYADRVREVSAQMDATNPDLSAFHARGAKLIVLENLGDFAQSPYAGIAYVQSVKARLGEARAQQFMRLYTAPNVDHVGSGAPGNADLLGALSAWVEQGRAPQGLELVEQAPKAPFDVIRARPLCEWPAWPRYVGGPEREAASFRCTP